MPSAIDGVGAVPNGVVEGVIATSTVYGIIATEAGEMLLPELPVMTLAEPLPVPLILATPSKVRFSTSPSDMV